MKVTSNLTSPRGESMQNFIPAFVEQQHKAGKKSGTMKGTALFADIGGFTRLTEHAFKLGDAGAEFMSRELVKLFDPMVAAVHKRGGFIAAFAGDAFMSVFPESGKNGVATAARAREAARE